MRKMICLLAALALLGGSGALEGQQETEVRISTEGGGMFVTRSFGEGPASSGPGATRTVPVGTAALSGTVTAIATGRPLNNVRLMLTASGDTGASPAQTVLAGNTSGDPSLSRVAVSDEGGRFTFQALPAGRFTLTASRDQYLTIAFGAARPQRPGVAIPLTDGQRVDVTLAMIRGGVIAGTVRDGDGEPVVNAQVRVSRVTYANGIKRLATQGFTQADDRGVYRIAGLQPGEYFVSAVRGPGASANVEQARADAAAFDAALAAARQTGRSPATVTYSAARLQAPGAFSGTYYPSAANPATASPVKVAGGDERSGIDITSLDIHTVNVSGLVANIPPELSGRIQVTMTPSDPMLDAGVSAASTVAPDGSFTVGNLPPGTYTVNAQVYPTAGPMLGRAGGPSTVDPAQRFWGLGSIVLDGQPVPPVVITLKAPLSVSGTVSGQGRALSVSLVRDPASPSALFPLTPGPVSADGSFTIAGVPAGRYAIQISGTGRPKSAVLNGQDVLDLGLVVDGEKDITGLEIALTTQVSQLTGIVSNSTGAGVADYTIVVAPADRRFWVPGSRRIQVARPDLAGRYAVGGLPAGEYLLAAVIDLEPGQQFDSEFLADLASAAVPVTITDGGQHTRDIRVSR